MVEAFDSIHGQVRLRKGHQVIELSLAAPNEVHSLRIHYSSVTYTATCTSSIMNFHWWSWSSTVTIHSSTQYYSLLLTPPVTTHLHEMTSPPFPRVHLLESANPLESNFDANSQTAHGITDPREQAVSISLVWPDHGSPAPVVVVAKHSTWPFLGFGAGKVIEGDRKWGRRLGVVYRYEEMMIIETPSRIDGVCFCDNWVRDK